MPRIKRISAVPAPRLRRSQDWTIQARSAFCKRLTAIFATIPKPPRLQSRRHRNDHDETRILAYRSFTVLRCVSLGVKSRTSGGGLRQHTVANTGTKWPTPIVNRRPDSLASGGTVVAYPTARSQVRHVR